MKIHERHFLVEDAKQNLSDCLLDSIKEYKLTYGEITKILAEELSTWAMYRIREERHPGEDKKGDEA